MLSYMTKKRFYEALSEGGGQLIKLLHLAIQRRQRAHKCQDQLKLVFSESLQLVRDGLSKVHATHRITKPYM